MIAMLSIKRFIYLSLLLVILSSCNNGSTDTTKPEPIEVPKIELALKFKRFEHDLMQMRASTDSNSIKLLKREYNDFFEIWLSQLSGVLSPTQKNVPLALIAANLSQYLNDKYIVEVNEQCANKFKDLSPLENELSDVFKRYKVLFPSALIPQLVTYTSPFTSNVMAMDSTLGLGLHFYLGEKYKYYPSLGLPHYMVRRFSQEYMLSDLVKGWLDSEFINDSTELNCLSQMLYQGKLLYLTEILSPETADTLLTGYTEMQMKWSEENEYKIWTYIVENQVLYNTNAKEYIRFINDGNGTNGFPDEAPARLGVFIGWKIIRAFMNNNHDITPEQLVKIGNAQLILAKSGYKPLHKN